MVYLLVGIGGAIGSVLRYLLYYFTFQQSNSNFPTGTLFANVIGAFFLGWFTKKIVERKVWRGIYSKAVGTGMIGAFTTFSTLSNETIALLQNELYVRAVVYLLLSVIGGLSAAYAGYIIGAKKSQESNND